MRKKRKSYNRRKKDEIDEEKSSIVCTCKGGTYKDRIRVCTGLYNTIHETERNQLEALSFVFPRMYLCVGWLCLEKRHAANSSYIGNLESRLFTMMNTYYVYLHKNRLYIHAFRFWPVDAMPQTFFCCCCCCCCCFCF